MLNVTYAEVAYADFPYAECRGALRFVLLYQGKTL
jgi:hypothetical protein